MRIRELKSRESAISYPRIPEKWVRALRYPFVNVQRDFFCRVFNLEEAPDGQKVPYTANVDPATVTIEKSGVIENGLAPAAANGQIRPVTTYNIRCRTDLGVYEAEDRVPLLAIGSNSSDEQLNRKFKNTAYENDMMIMPAWLRNYTVVYMPLFAPYGSVPATVYPTPGVSCRVTIGFCTRAQASDIIGTESPYDLRRLHDSAVLDNGMDFTDALAFVSAHGILSFDGASLLRISEIPHEGPHAGNYTALTQREVLLATMEKLGETGPLEDFILSLIEDDAKRWEADLFLRKKYALPFGEGDQTTIIIPGKTDPEEAYRRY